MKIQDVLHLIDYYKEQSLILFLEGNFRKCYNQHAFYFTENVKNMRVHTRWYKNIQRHVHTIGFPNTVLQTYIEALERDFSAKLEEETQNYLRFSVVWENTPPYTLWHEEKIILLSRSTQNTVEAPCYHPVIAQLMAFDTANSTPVQALNFVANIQATIHTVS